MQQVGSTFQHSCNISVPTAARCGFKPGPIDKAVVLQVLDWRPGHPFSKDPRYKIDALTCALCI